MKARLPKEYQSKSQAELMRQAQEMQENMTKMQQELEEREYSASAGGDMVKVTVNGKHEVLKLDISADLIEDAKDDKEMLEDLVITAINSAIKQAADNSDDEMGKLTSGLNIPGLF